MARIDNTRLVITGYHCSYSPCSFNKLFQFWTAQAILKFLVFHFLRGNSWKGWNKDAKADFTTLTKNAKGKSSPRIPKDYKHGTHLSIHMILWQRDDVGICDKLKAELSSLTRSMATKLRNLLAYGEVKEPKAKKNKNFFLSEDVWLPKFAGCWHMVNWSP